MEVVGICSHAWWCSRGMAVEKGKAELLFAEASCSRGKYSVQALGGQTSPSLGRGCGGSRRHQQVVEGIRQDH